VIQRRPNTFKRIHPPPFPTPTNRLSFSFDPGLSYEVFALTSTDLFTHSPPQLGNMKHTTGVPVIFNGTATFNRRSRIFVRQFPSIDTVRGRQQATQNDLATRNSGYDFKNNATRSNLTPSWTSFNSWAGQGLPEPAVDGPSWLNLLLSCQADGQTTVAPLS
jgi:hypothetical protein